MDILSNVKISGSLDANSVGATFGSFTQGICGYDLNFQRGDFIEELCIGNNISIKPCGLIELREINSINIDSLYIYKNGCVSTTYVYSDVVNSNRLSVDERLSTSEFYYGPGLTKYRQPYYRNYNVAVPSGCSAFELYKTNSATSLNESPPIIQSINRDTGHFVLVDYKVICGDPGSFSVNILINPESESRFLNFSVFSF